MARRAPRSEAAKYAEALPDEFLDCRVDNHDWVSRVRWNPNDRMWHKVKHCRRCTTDRILLYSANGDLLDSKYDYVDGYQNKGKGRLTGTDLNALRVESFGRHAEEPMPIVKKGN